VTVTTQKNNKKNNIKPVSERRSWKVFKICDQLGRSDGTLQITLIIKLLWK